MQSKQDASVQWLLFVPLGILRGLWEQKDEGALPLWFLTFQEQFKPFMFRLRLLKNSPG